MKDKNKTNVIITILFILIIFLPLGLQAFPRLKSLAQVHEKRILAEKPKLTFDSISTFPKSAENYFNDTFLLRNFFINLNSKLRLILFNSSGSPKVLVGKKGWLFLHGEEANEGASITNHLGLLPDGYEDFFRYYKLNIEEKKNYLSKMGIEYIFVIAPDKSSIYPEYLPNGYSNTKRKSNTDLLIEFLKINSDVNILDLRIPLKNNKKIDQPLYYKNDTHWNNLGAYFAYQYISNYISKSYPSIKTKNIDDFTLKKIKTNIPGGLGEVLALTEYDDVEYILTPKVPYSYVHMSGSDSEKKPQVYRTGSNDLPNAIIFRDSFMEAVEPYLSDDFNFVVYLDLWRQWGVLEDIDPLIAKVQPNIVIEERVERHLLPSVRF